MRLPRRIRLAKLERKLVWIMGSPRSGSTWLTRLLDGAGGVSSVSEPLIGLHLGLFASSIVANPNATHLAGQRMGDVRIDEGYFFASQFRTHWNPGLRRLILERMEAEFDSTARRCVIREPNGSEGADLIMGALPEARLIFLVRDGRDVVDSLLDAYTAGSWLDLAFGVAAGATNGIRANVLEHESRRWVARTEIVGRAYASHSPARRLIVRYEDLIADTDGVLVKIYSWLGIETPPNLASLVSANAFSSLPRGSTGSGKFHRSAAPGRWRQNLSPSEQETVLTILSPTLAVLGYEVAPR